jgi:protein involved in polysaccharide export with SLBB domain
MHLSMVAALGCAMLGTPKAMLAQQPDSQAMRRPDSTLLAARRPMVTRAELQSALDALRRGLASSAYSPAIRSAKQAEADVISERLANGDIRAGDDLKVEVLSDPGLSAIYTISPSRTLLLPGGQAIPMQGVLRSEVQDYLKDAFKRYLINPSITVTTYIRISMFGALNKPGVFAAPASMLLTEEIMKDGGGPTNNVRWKKSTIKRGDRVIVDGPAFDLAVREGATLDQLNVQAGDRIDLDGKPATGLVWRIIGGISALGGLVYLAIRVL